MNFMNKMLLYETMEIPIVTFTKVIENSNIVIDFVVSLSILIHVSFVKLKTVIRNWHNIEIIILSHELSNYTRKPF